MITLEQDTAMRCRRAKEQGASEVAALMAALLDAGLVMPDHEPRGRSRAARIWPRFSRRRSRLAGPARAGTYPAPFVSCNCGIT